MHVPQSPFSDLGFESGLNRLYFVCTRLYTSFFVSTPLTFVPLPGGRGSGHTIPLFWFWIRKWTQSFVFALYMIVYIFFICTPLTFLPLPGAGGGGLGTCYPLLFWFWIWKWAQSFVFCYYTIVYIFFCLYFRLFSYYS